MSNITHRVVPLCLVSLAAGCVVGSGRSAERHFPLYGATWLENRTLLEVSIRRGDAAAARLTCDDNLIDDFRVEVQGQTVVIDDRDRNLSPEARCAAEVVLERLEGPRSSGSGGVEVVDAFLELREVSVSSSGAVRVAGPVSAAGHDGTVRLATSSSGSLTVRDVRATALDVQVTSSGSVTLAGAVEALEARVSSSGSLRGRALAAGRARLETSSSGSIEATVTDAATVRISSSGSVVLHGRPRIDGLDDSGSGALELR